MYKRFQVIISEEDFARIVGRRVRGSIGKTNEPEILSFRADRRSTPRRSPINKTLCTNHSKTTVSDDNVTRITITVGKEEGVSATEVIRGEVKKIIEFLGGTPAAIIDPFGY